MDHRRPGDVRGHPAALFVAGGGLGGGRPGAPPLRLTAIRREGEDVSAWRFLEIGLLVMPPALVRALDALILV